jgi:serine/threonine-protein kinase HipA
MKGHRYRKALVYFKDLEAGVLEEYKNGFRFTYNEDFKKKGIPISVSLSLLNRSHESSELFPFFEGLLPEGWYLDIVSAALKIDKTDHFGLLISTCRETMGAVSIREIK